MTAVVGCHDEMNYEEEEKEGKGGREGEGE